VVVAEVVAGVVVVTAVEALVEAAVCVVEAVVVSAFDTVSTLDVLFSPLQALKAKRAVTKAAIVVIVFFVIVSL